MILIGYFIQFIYICFLQILNEKKYRNIPLIIGIIFSLLLLIFNKGSLVGTDYEMYKKIFDFLSIQDKFPKFYIKNSGWGLMVYFYVIGKFFQDFKYAVLFLIFFHNFVIYKFLNKYSYKNIYYFSYLTYFCFFYISNTFNPMKQIIAICIFSLGMRYIIEKNFLKYILTIIIATLFHTLSLVLLPMYQLCRNKIKIKVILFIFFMCLVIVIGLRNNIMLIGKYFSNNIRYYQYFLGVFNNVKFNLLNFFEVYIPLIFLFFFDYKYSLRKKNIKNKIFINFYYIYSFLYLITIVDKMMGARFVLFLSLVFSVIYPYIFYLLFKYLKIEKLYYIFYPLWMLVFLYFRHIRILI